MADVVIHRAAFSSGAAANFRRFAALLERTLYGAVIADGTRRTLDELPDNLLRDMGIARNEIPFAAGALASAYIGPTGGARDRSSGEPGAAVHRLPHVVFASR